MTPATRRLLGRTVGVVASVAALLGVLAPSAVAESVVSSQARAAGVAWLPWVPAERLPAASKRPVICLIDTGVAVTPDTPADSPEGPIVARLSLAEGEPGTPSAADPNGSHGTMMASAIAAPQNGWGIVGVWPGARIVSIRASMDAGGIIDTSIIDAIAKCRSWAVANNEQIAAVNISLGTTGTSALTNALMVNWVQKLHQRGATVVAAGGNDPAGTTQWPASVDGVIAVGASQLTGGWCAQATHDWRTTIAAPGCDVAAAQLTTGAEGIWPGAGSSHATAMTSATIAAMRSLRPDATREQVEQWVTTSGAMLDDAHLLDGAAIATAASVGDLVALTPAPQGPAPPSPSTPQQTPPQPQSGTAFVLIDSPHRVRVRTIGRTLRATISAPVTGVRLQIAVRYRGRWVTASGQNSVTLKRVGRPPRVWMRWTGEQANSPWAAYGQPRLTTARCWQIQTKPHGPKPPVGQTETT